ncbi:MAG: hypothetical protein FWH37_07940 [Candidatus Bathyarchaeota archaeon]|nr:hypothetical protein [Candidatus Termiticorpusculum sp.]
MLTQKLLIKPTITITQQPTTHLTLNIPEIDQLFPSFKLGDFAVFYGSSKLITSLTTRICIRAQIPKQQGGLASNVNFIDAGNTFRQHKITQTAQQHGLDPRKTLKNIHITQTYTAYQLTSLITEKLEETIKKFNTKIIIISDIAKPFLDENIPEEEAQKVYSQILNYLSSFAKKHQIILITTYITQNNTQRNMKLKEITLTKTNINISFNKTLYTSEIELEKHPTYILGVADYPTENTPLTDYINKQQTLF